MSVDDTGWTVGADRIAPRDWSGEVVQMPSGRLHAVSDPGLLQGQALCLAPVILLDPRDWRWPDDGDEEWPLCGICLTLTHVGSDRGRTDHQERRWDEWRSHVWAPEPDL
jgi:hypothetical protein